MIQVSSIISDLRETASSKKLLESAYSPAVRWRIPSKREREACSSAVSRSSGALGSLANRSEGANGVWIVTCGVSARSSWICAIAVSLGILVWVFQTGLTHQQGANVVAQTHLQRPNSAQRVRTCSASIQEGAHLRQGLA